MYMDPLVINFNDTRVPLKNILHDITPNLFSDQEAFEIMHRSAKDAIDETDNSIGIMTLTDGRISNEKLDLRLDKKRMRYEANRLETFKIWPETSPVRPGPLARAGFYYTGVQDIVRCFSCNGQVQAWEYGDTAMGEHKKHFPNCDFVQGRDTDNVALLELHQRPDYERKLSQKIEQSQKDIERRAKEKEAVLLQEQVGARTESRNLSSVAGGTSSSSSATEHEDNIDEDESTSLFRDYKKEYERLQSFETWPRTSPIEPRDLAKAGFYYTNEKDFVQCFACFGKIGRWKPSDIPALEHRNLFPSCPFVKGLDVENEPISGAPVFPVGMPTPMRVLSAPLPTREQVLVGQKLQRQGSGQFRAHLGPLNNCRHPMYAPEEARVKSFQHWPASIRISATPRLLARAGFFYTGVEDECKCFYCDGGLKNWEPNDDPWTEHAKWFPRCEWLIQQRGESFIIHVQRVNPPPVGGPGKVRSSEGVSEQDYPWTNDHGLRQLQFTAPHIGQDETYYDPPHIFKPSYQERQAEVSAVSGHVREGARGGLKGGEQQKELTIEEEKAAALREYEKNHKEPEAVAEFNFKSSKPLEARQVAAEMKLKEKNAKPSLDDLMQNATTQLAAEMGYDTRLIRYVIAEHLRKTGQEFSSPDELLEAIWVAEKMDIDLLNLDRYSEGSSGRAAAGPSSGVEGMGKNFESSSSIEFQAKKLAGLSIDDEPKNNDERIKAAKKQRSSPQSLTSGSAESLDDKQLCKICLDKELNTVFMPCKHLATCEDCASMVKECPMCRQTIFTSFRVYLP